MARAARSVDTPVDCTYGTAQRMLIDHTRRTAVGRVQPITWGAWTRWRTASLAPRLRSGAPRCPPPPSARQSVGGSCASSDLASGETSPRRVAGTPASGWPCSRACLASPGAAVAVPQHPAPARRPEPSRSGLSTDMALGPPTRVIDHASSGPCGMPLFGSAVQTSDLTTGLCTPRTR